jgi:hypothetical protein
MMVRVLVLLVLFGSSVPVLAQPDALSKKSPKNIRTPI